MTENTLLSKWRESLSTGEVGVTLAEVHHPLEIYVGANEFGRAKMQIRTKERLVEPRLADVVEVSRHGNDAAWILTLNLRDQRFTEVFLQLAADVIRRTRSEADETSALLVMNRVFEQWRRLLTPSPSRRLGLEELRGLLGEIWHLVHRVCSDTAIADAMEAWVGPLGAPQDFTFEEGVPREIKSVGPSASRVKIANEQQLDVPGMELVVIDLPQVSEPDANSITLVSLLERVASLLDEQGVGHDGLYLRMKRLGVDLEDSWYAEQWFRVTAESVFEVTPDFPAVRGSELLPGVEKVRYEIARTVLEPFKVRHETFG